MLFSQPLVEELLFENSIAFTRQEFEEIIQKMEDEKLSIIEQARTIETPLIDYLRQEQLNPKPTGNNPNSWVATCPNARNHHIRIVTTNDE